MSATTSSSSSSQGALALSSPSSSSSRYSLLYHKARCFDVKTLHVNTDRSSEECYILSSSEDGTAVLWSSLTRKHLFVFRHSSDSEVLRSSFAGDSVDTIITCGADGTVLLWERVHNSPTAYKYVISSRLTHNEAQIYACESLLRPNCPSITVVTAADNIIYIWNRRLLTHLQPPSTDVVSDDSACHTPQMVAFEPVENAAVFGGSNRNEEGKAFIFDVKIAPASLCSDAATRDTIVVAMAMSDCSVRIEQISLTDDSLVSSHVGGSRQLRLVPLQPYLLGDGDGVQPSEAPMITSVNWKHDGSLLLAALGNGEVAIIDPSRGIVRKVIRAHTAACFGALFMGATAPHENRIVSWARDGRVKLWSVLITDVYVSFESKRVVELDKFPVYCCDIISDDTVVVAGGSNASFVGVPVQVVSLKVLDE
jgi:WD40 repeat protein